MFEHGQKCRLGQYYGRNRFTRPVVTPGVEIRLRSD